MRVLTLSLLILLPSLRLAHADDPAADKEAARAREEAKARVEQLGERVSDLYAAGKYAEARPLAEEALKLAEKWQGADDPGTATPLNNLGELLRVLGDLKGAKPLLERALAIAEKALGPDDPELTPGLCNLALLLTQMGDLKGARPLFERALAIDLKALGPDDPATATELTNLAVLLQETGDLNGARPLFERALAIWEKARGPDHPDTATGLNNLALLLQDMGDLQGARPLYERALAVRERALGPDHPMTSTSLNNLATLLEAMGDRKGARSLYEKALAIAEKSLGRDHPGVATDLNNLAMLLQAMGEMEGARPLFERALAIGEKALGPDHPDTAWSLGNLGQLLRDMGDRKGAKPLLERALAIDEKALGPDHADTARSRNLLAALLREMGDVEGARPLFERAWTSNQDALHRLLPALSSRERCAMIQDRAPQLMCYLAAFEDDPTKTYSAACAWKGAALRASAAALRLPADAPIEARRVAERLAEARASLARLYHSPPASQAGEPSVAEQVDAARKQVEQDERRLADLLPDVLVRAFGEAGPSEVQKALPEGSVLVDVLENGGRLHAWVVRPIGDVKYFPLGKASEFEPLAVRFREALEKDDEKGWKQAGAALRANLEKPLDEALQGRPQGPPLQLLVSPDGTLATIPWGLLPDGDGFLVERLPIVCVGGGAWMVMAARTKARVGEGLLAFGDVDYAGMAGVPALPATKAEVQQVRERFHARYADKPCTALMGKEATKAAFLSQAGKARYVHVATHGFFDLDHLGVALGGTRGFAGELASARLDAASERKDLGGWNPLLLSGILLAGQDGVVTAEELQGLDLTGVELVVLSACETGRGELAAGEGVLGLSRALAVAGARGFMLSLWEVPDAKTRELMDGFYAGLWSDRAAGCPPQRAGAAPTAEEALRSTQLRMLARDRAAKAFRPSTWGAWVLMR